MSTATTHIKTEKQLVPALRFNEFDGEWEKRKLGEVSNFLDGRRKPIKSGDRAKMQGEYPYYGASGIIDYVNNYIFDEELILLGEDGENIVSRNSPLAFRVSGKCWINNHAHVIVPKEGIDIDFLTHNLERINYLIYNTGTAQPKLNQEVCRSIPSYFASYPEQQKIASFLSAVDEKIQQLTKKKELLDRYKKGVMQQLFSGQLRFKDENGNPYPDWEEKRLNEITTPIKRTSDRVIENIMTISGANGFMHQKDRFSQVIAANSLSKYTHLLKDEFAYNRGNSKSYKYGCIYKMRDPEALIPYVYHSFKLNEGVPEFMEQLFRAKYMDRQLRRLISSSARMDGLLNIGAKAFFECKVFFPVLEEQQKIAIYLSSIDTKIGALNNQITQTQTFKKGLLQQMFV
ncbi:restriction endonuclease subunit S [Flavobacteriaceae bacterium]|nr:restriction endonuclease subunit S [Flavobacteriaceae bacterium]